MNKKILNLIIKKMAEKQNKNKKLNAGELREAVSLFLQSIIELSDEQKLEFVSSISKKK